MINTFLMKIICKNNKSGGIRRLGGRVAQAIALYAEPQRRSDHAPGKKLVFSGLFAPMDGTALCYLRQPGRFGRLWHGEFAASVRIKNRKTAKRNCKHRLPP